MSARSIADRAGQAGELDAAPDGQDGLFDRVVENDLLTAALEQRERAREKKAKATGDFKTAHEKAKAQIDALDLAEDETVRCGRFRIKASMTAGRSVAFDTSPSRRLTISLLD